MSSGAENANGEETSSTLGTVPLRSVPRPPSRRRPLPDVKDDAKRSVSVRILTSDFGRIKAAAKRLRVRESDVFRYLLGIGLVRLSSVLDGRAQPASRRRLFLEIAREFSADFGMGIKDILALLAPLSDGQALLTDARDVQLLQAYLADPALVEEESRQRLLTGALTSALDEEIARGS